MDRPRIQTGTKGPTNAFSAEEIAAIQAASNSMQQVLMAVAILDSKLPSGGLEDNKSSRPIIVGGSAVEFWTTGGYRTQDVDIVIVSQRDIEDVFAASGFSRQGKYWEIPDTPLMFEFPGATLTNGKDAYDRAVGVMVEGRGEALVIGIEDIFVDRICSGVFDKIKNNFKWAREMAGLHYEKMDWNAIRDISANQGPVVIEYVSRIQAEAKELNDRLRNTP